MKPFSKLIVSLVWVPLMASATAALSANAPYQAGISEDHYVDDASSAGNTAGSESDKPNGDSRKKGKALVSIKLSDGAVASLGEDGVLNLEDGDAIVYAQEQALVKAGPTLTRITDGTIVLISAHNEGFAVRTLFDTRTGTVETTVPGQKFTVDVGHELYVTRGFEKLTEMVSGDAVLRRGMKTILTSAGYHVLCSEFAPSSVLKRVDLLKQMIRNQSERERRLIAKIMKAAAALHVVTNSHGPFMPVGRVQPNR